MHVDLSKIEIYLLPSVTLDLMKKKELLITLGSGMRIIVLNLSAPFSLTH
jgi:hypothetical protein